MNKKAKKKQKPQPELSFKEGDLVGGKVKWHPMWPGIVEKVFITTDNKRKYTIRFFETGDCSDKCMSIKHFRDFNKQDKACNKKEFKAAYILCQQEYDKRFKEDKLFAKTEQERWGLYEPINHYETSVNEVEDKPLDSEETKKDEEAEAIDSAKTEIEVDQNHESTPNPIKLEQTSVSESSDPQEVPLPIVDQTKVIAGDEILEKPAGAIVKPSTSEKDADNSRPHKRIKRSARNIKTTISNSEENDGSYKVSIDIDRAPQGEPLTQLNSLKTEGENLILNPTRQQIIAKLEEKVAKKIKEKEARKEEVKAAKLSEKIIKNLRIVNKYLEKFLIASDRVSSPGNQTSLLEWNTAARNYQNKVFPVLDKCVKYSDKQYSNHEEISCEYRRSKDIIDSIITNLKAGRKNDQVSLEVKKKFKKCLRESKNRATTIEKLLSSNKFENPKNAMTERSTNDVK